MLLPHENIRNFSHRLSNLVNKVYQVEDKKAVDRIKYIRFLQAIPSNIKIKMLEEGIDNFNSAVNRAQELQNIYNTDNSILVQNTQESSHQISEQLADLSAKVNALTFSNTKDVQDNDSKTDERSHRFNNNRPSHAQRYKSRRVNTQHKSERYTSSRVFCQLCRGPHEALQCRKYLNLINNRNFQPQSNRGRSYNNNFRNTHRDRSHLN